MKLVISSSATMCVKICLLKKTPCRAVPTGYFRRMWLERGLEVKVAVHTACKGDDGYGDSDGVGYVHKAGLK